MRHAIVATALLLTVSSAFAADAPKGFTPLFNGKDLTGWWGMDTKDPATYLNLPAADLAKLKEASLADIRSHWSVKDGVLVNDGHGLYLTTDKNFRDFELLIEYKTVPTADSGIYLRGYPQVQIWDSADPDPQNIGKAKGSGGLWNNSPGAAGKDPLVKADKPLGEWNKFRIVMVGEKVSVWLNGKLVVDHARMESIYDRNNPLLPAGPIQLQTHGGEIQWKDVFIREIGSDEANTILRNGGIDKKPVAGFKPLFNGKDFGGWAGATENYEIIEGAIVCKAGKGGNLYTEEEFSDFIVQLEFKLPPGGNNGLAIRYPGQGEPYVAGMTELQVLDDHYEQATGHKIDPRQAHGSAYGMVAAARGYQRAIGEWNYQVVTVQGSTIQVELNGVRILNTDVSKVTEFMSNTPHPNKDVKSGHFGFAGHNDPVQFRHVAIRRLD